MIEHWKYTTALNPSWGWEKSFSKNEIPPIKRESENEVRKTKVVVKDTLNN